MVVASNCFRWVTTIVCMASLWLAGGQARGDTPDEPGPTRQPPAAAELVVPTSEGLWNAGNEGDGEFPSVIGNGHPNTIWFRADYLLWWTTGARLPALVTTSPQGTAPTDAGVLGVPGTTVLCGDEVVCGDARSGFRTNLGIWLDNWQLWDLEFDYFSPGGNSADFSATSSGDPILARPYFNVVTNSQLAMTAAYPGLATGTVTVNAKDYFQSFGLTVGRCLWDYRADAPYNPESVLSNLPMVPSFRLDLLGAFRYYGLNDSVTIGESAVFANYPLNNPTYQNVSVVHLDSFRARNDFYGGELGLRSRMYRGRWSLEVLGKLALGSNRRVVNIQGVSVTTIPGVVTILSNSGALAVPSNIGSYTQNTFTAIPTLGVELGYRWNNHWRTYVGYDLIYWNQVSRAGEQIDLHNGSTGTGRYPLFPDSTASFVAQGLNVGAEFRF
jgi:hypothetical protein